MPEVWTHDNTSKRFEPRYDAVVQSFILLSNIEGPVFPQY